MGVRRAIVAFPEAAELARIESIRRRFDPLAQLIRAHITLVFPFESELTLDLLRRHVEDAVRGVRPFELSYAGARIVEDEYVFLEVGVGASHLTELHDRLHTGLLAGLKSDRAYAPHTTVARTTDLPGLRNALHAAAEIHLDFSAAISAVSACQIAPHAPRRIEFAVSLTP